jgi:hypothetical protein
VAGGFVEDQDARLLVQRPGQEDALLLATGQHRAHVADQGAVAHRQRGDLVVDVGQPGALLDAARSGAGSKKQMLSAMEPANRVSSCITVPISAGRLAAVAAQAGLADQRRPRPAEDAEDEVDESRLAAARGADEGHRLAGRDLQVDAVPTHGSVSA